MKPLFNPAMIKKLIGILILLLLIKLLWFVAELTFFPAQGVNHAENKRAKPLYYRIKLTPNQAPPPVVKKPKKAVGSIKDIKLMGVYNASDQIVATVQYKGKTKVIGKGESVNGFILQSAGNTYVIFVKNGKEYKVSLRSSKEKMSGITHHASSSVSRKNNAPSPQKEEGEITDAGDHKIVDRSLLEHYTKNMDEIYKNIGIKEIKKGNKIEGFRITFVKRGTPFAKLGLKRGDVLKAVNGQILDSYEAAFDTYKNINDAEGLTLTVQRGNKEMELEYEIN
jgi:general secretion pathway protein C